jgi:hypothetical protein
MSRKFKSRWSKLCIAYQIQHRDFHHTLIEVRGLVFDDLDSHHFLRLQVLALHYLTKSTLAQHIENEIPIPGSGVLDQISRKNIAISVETYL